MTSNQRMNLTLATKLKRLPPIACFIIARKGQHRNIKAMMPEEIAFLSGLPLDRVHALSWMTSWDSVSCREMMRFSHGCGVCFDDGANFKKHMQFLKRRNGRFPHLIKLKNYGEYRKRIKLILELRT